MQPDYWHKQTALRPLFDDLLWSRPENKLHAGKLAVIGGHAQEFVAVASAYQYAQAAGAGSVRVLLPDSLQKSVGRVFEAGEYAPSTPIGSFGRNSLANWLSLATWSDGVLLAGDLGRNSETGILLEQFLDKYDGQVTLTRDAITYIVTAPMLVLNRPNSCLVLSMSQLQKFGTSAHFIMPFTLSMALTQLVDRLHEFTKRYSIDIVTKHFDNYVVAVDGQVSTTKLKADKPIWRLETAAHTSTWWLQNPTKPFEALTSAALSVANQ